ncbi:MFS transporter [Dolichospermum circinale CS-1225]|uniref:MFS transporter n=1 Tax=Dolichospermum circinale CS-537/01 TaxID=3021739 RepID=A0ABT5A6T4_9CYAN|nr:MFS transporter [Dolichospermum circinale]MDB9459516.1 MFS transporter [Dolichospermum circinale CS-545/17]MDB9467849.1 MFS transporter [Dolichospermum circinale CS-539/09]MDB9469051.1 MFS transporter [Dolichospermum circinale CS-539]MDB9487653.1 MFS transporter [Dolichospermum circinale CS-537/01]MDB9521029.1 MFS transporter [Dolichospermum circinale CS-1225]
MLHNKPTTINHGFAALVKNRGFMLLWIGQLISQLADKVFFVLMIALLKLYLPINSGGEDGRFYLYMAFTVPAMLFGSVGGIIVDRVPKKLIMVGSDAVRGVLMILIPFLPREFAILLFFTFSISTITQFFAPAEQAAIPLLVKKEGLMAANALFSSTMMAALIIGNAVATPMLNWFESFNKGFGKELIVGCLYLLSALIMMPIHFREHRQINQETAPINPWSEFILGLRYLKQNRLVWNAMLQIVTLYCVFAALIELAIGMAARLHLAPEEFSSFVAAAGVGMVIGAGILGHFGHRLHHKPLPLIGFIIMAFSLGLFIFIDNQPLALGLCIFLGVGAAFVNVPMQTLIQQQTPPEMHGKVFGFQNHAINIALTAPLLITTKLVNAFGLSVVLLGMSIFVGGIGIRSWQNTRKVLQDVI